MKKSIATLLAAAIAAGAYAQSFYVNHPPKLKWKRIETAHLEIVYPEGMDSVARHTANLMNHVYEPVTKTLRTQPRKISFFLCNQSAESNGYVTPIHPMMAWYTTPMQDVSRLGADDWFQTLAVHEYRHVAQFEKMDMGMTHVGKILFGTSGAAVLGIISHPMWFAEGDAVASETALTRGGRGRLPSFGAPMRALVLEGKPHSYDRVYFGSHRYYYPNHYTLGYYLAVYGRRQYGEDFWPEMLGGVSRFSANPYQFSRIMRRKTGMRVSAFHQKAVEDLRRIWTEQESGRRYSAVEPLSDTGKRVFTNYTNPLILPDSSIFAVKAGFDDASQFVTIKNGTEKQLFRRYPTGAVTASGYTLAWCENISDVRFLERSYSDIFLYNVETNELKHLTHKSKYFAPSVSPDGASVAAVQMNEMMSCALHILDAQTGEAVAALAGEPGEFFRTPAWDTDGASIVVQVTKGQSNSFVRYTVQNGARQTIYGPTEMHIFAPSFAGEYLLFNSPATGIDAIHALDMRTGEEYVAAQTRFGAQNPVISPGGESIVFEDYDSDGYSIVKSAFSPASLQPLSTVAQVHEDYFQPLVAQEQGGSIFDQPLPDSSFTVSDYSPIRNIVNIHSWLFAPAPEGASFALYSNDKLNQLSASAGVTYNDIENDFSEYLSLSYMKYFPVISFTGIHGLRTQTYNYTDDNDDEQTFNYHWREQSADLSVELPFNFSRGHFTRTASFKWSALYKNVTGMDISEQSEGKYADINGTVVPLRFWADILNVQTPSRRDLMPNWGQQLYIRTEYVPESVSDFGTVQFAAVAREYLPGFMPSHGFYLQGGYEWQDPRDGMYRAPSYMSIARGYEQERSDDWAVAKVGYRLPLLYPDIALGGTVYFKRISMELFADRARLFDRPRSERDYTSAGAEFTVDFHPFRWLFLPMSIGLRSSYTIEEDAWRMEMVFMGMTF